MGLRSGARPMPSPTPSTASVPLRRLRRAPGSVGLLRSTLARFPQSPSPLLVLRVLLGFAPLPSLPRGVHSRPGRRVRASSRTIGRSPGTSALGCHSEGPVPSAWFFPTSTACSTTGSPRVSAGSGSGVRPVRGPSVVPSPASGEVGDGRTGGPGSRTLHPSKVFSSSAAVSPRGDRCPPAVRPGVRPPRRGAFRSRMNGAAPGPDASRHRRSRVPVRSARSRPRPALARGVGLASGATLGPSVSVSPGVSSGSGGVFGARAPSASRLRLRPVARSNTALLEAERSRSLRHRSVVGPSRAPDRARRSGGDCRSQRCRRSRLAGVARSGRRGVASSRFRPLSARRAPPESLPLLVTERTIDRLAGEPSLRGERLAPSVVSGRSRGSPSVRLSPSVGARPSSGPFALARVRGPEPSQVLASMSLLARSQTTGSGDLCALRAGSSGPSVVALATPSVPVVPRVVRLPVSPREVRPAPGPCSTDESEPSECVLQHVRAPSGPRPGAVAPSSARSFLGFSSPPRLSASSARVGSDDVAVAASVPAVSRSSRGPSRDRFRTTPASDCSVGPTGRPIPSVRRRCCVRRRGLLGVFSRQRAAVHERGLAASFPGGARRSPLSSVPKPFTVCRAPHSCEVRASPGRRLNRPFGRTVSPLVHMSVH